MTVLKHKHQQKQIIIAIPVTSADRGPAGVSGSRRR